jgi:saccharopine dehydrogenase-like NADP-dependent oxidoreductase
VDEIVVFGAYGHTGRFVVAELQERGLIPRVSGRDEDKLRALGGTSRPASVTDSGSLDHALSGAAAVINCAGPFGATTEPLIAAAERAGIPYVDVSAEIEVVAETLSRTASVPVVPAMAFFGGLGDLLATTAMADWTSADEIHVAYGLSGWHPTAGTRLAGQASRERRGDRRVRYANGHLEYVDGPMPTLEWPFPTGPRQVIGEFSMADVVTVPSHLSVPEVRTYMTVEAAQDVSSPNSPTPTAVDERGRSAQTFVVDVVVRKGNAERRAVASGQDIYAISAPLAVEAVQRILAGQTRTTGVAAAGRMFDAPDFLNALSKHLKLDA